LNFSIATSFVTEIELMGWYKIPESAKKSLRLLLHDCTIIDLTIEIKKLAIEIKQRNKIKLPDALIASTAIILQIPLVTADQDFKKINGLEIIWVDPVNP
jgi:predicted nucleic acid-binding protein